MIIVENMSSMSILFKEPLSHPHRSVTDEDLLTGGVRRKQLLELMGKHLVVTSVGYVL
jgi:hypothetical protein